LCILFILRVKQNQYVLKLNTGHLGVDLGPGGKKNFFGSPTPNPPSKCEAAKNINTKQERLTLGCRVTGA
jgi:hypothetical protein